jgi:hypothetical protein
MQRILKLLERIHNLARVRREILPFISFIIQCHELCIASIHLKVPF